MRIGWLGIILVTFALVARAEEAPVPQADAEPAPQSAEIPASSPPSFFRTIMSGLFGSSSPSNAPVPEPAMPPHFDPFAESVEVQPVENEKVDILTDYDIALREAQLRNRPLLVVFGATWCQWCRKLEDDLTKPEAQTLLTEWVVVKVDVDANPELANRLEASALPALRILDPLEKRVASQEGYLEPAALAEWLAANRKSADPILQQVLFDTAPPNDAAIEQLVALMAETNPATRSAAMARLAAHPDQTMPALVQTVRTGRLIQQLSACDILREWNAPIRQIDPWRPETLNDAEFASLVTWSKEKQVAIEPPNSKSPKVDTEAIDELLDRLIRSDATQRQGLIAQCVGIGPAVAVEVRARLSDTDFTNDASREVLRELLFNVLASRELRLKQPGVLAALARLDAESHRRAAEVVLRQAVSDDQPLVDELSRDADPLVREIAVMSLGRLGLLVDGERIAPLLKDSSPNVRTAILRALTEHPSDKAIQSLCDYLKRETNEDLLVHGAKSLGQLGSREEILATLAILANSQSWRVRAAAIEVAGQFMASGNVSSEPIHRVVNGKIEIIQPGSGNLPELLNKAIVDAAFEEDEFVAERALQLLPKLIGNPALDKTTLEEIAIALGDQPDQLRRMVKNVASGQRAQAYAPLVNLAKLWIDEEDGKRSKQATVLLSQLAPIELNSRLATLIGSGDRALRLAGMQAAIESGTAYRQQSLDAARRAWAIRTHDETIMPWYELTNSEKSKGSLEKPKINEPDASEVTSPNEKLEVDMFEAPRLFDTERPAPVQVPAKPAVPANDAIDSVEALFGTPPLPEPASVALLPNEPSPPTRGPRVIGDANLALPSKWLNHWQTELGKRPDWIAKCDAPTQKRLESSDPREQAVAQTLWLILGHTDQIEELFAAMKALETSDKSASEDLKNIDILSWLPGDQRLIEIKQRFEERDGDGERTIELLKQATWNNDRALADLIFELIETKPLADEQWNEMLADLVVRAQLGFASSDLPADLDENNYRYHGASPYHIEESLYAPPVPGRVEACNWLREKFQIDSSDRQRTIALIALAKLDHQTGVNAAIGIIRDAKNKSRLLEVALTVALFDAPQASAERAVEMLDHSVADVRLAAMQTLALPSTSIQRREDPLVPTIDNSASVLPGFWLATQPMPVNVLRKRLTDKDADVKAQAELLLLAAGEEIDLGELQNSLEELIPATSSLAIAAALAKANRTDASALQHYQSTYQNATDDWTSAELYKVLKVLKGDEAAKLRRRMREEKGASLFNSGPHLIPPPTIHY